MYSNTKIINVKGHDSILTIYISNSSNIETLAFDTEFNNIEILSINNIKTFINYIINQGKNIIQTNENNYNILYKGRQEKWRRYNLKSINEIMGNIDNIVDYNTSKVNSNIILSPNSNSNFNGIGIIHKNIINNIHPIDNSYYTIYNINTSIINSIPIILNTDYQYIDSNGIIKNINNNTAKSFSDNINCIFQKPDLSKYNFIFNDINILSVCPVGYNIN